MNLAVVLAVALLLAPGTVLRLALDDRQAIRRVGQPVSATIADDVYAYDRVVVPKGTKALGHVAALENLSKTVRAGRLLNGDLSPLHHVAIQFDTLVFGDGRRLPISTLPAIGIPAVSVAVADTSEPATRVGRARQEVKRKTRDSLHAFTRPGRLERLHDLLLDSLPYHHEYLGRGMRYAAHLVEPLAFGTVTGTETAPAGAVPAPGALLHARLETTIDSAASTRGMPIHATLVEPAMSSSGMLILPEGTELDGEVTFTRRARHLHRNGQLRFLFQNVRVATGEPQPLLAALSATELGMGVAIDDEGGVRATDPKTRFIAPVVTALIANAAVAQDGADAAEADGGIGRPGGNTVGRGAGGFVGLGLLGTVLSQTGRPAAVALAVFGFARSVYVNLLGRGHDVVMPADSPIELQLSPAPPGNTGSTGITER